MVENLLTAAQAGDRRALGRLLSKLDDGTLDVASLNLQTTAKCIGITGPPGVGKSTLTNSLITKLLAMGKSVAVLAVDPSSPITGGALLGDRIRMQALPNQLLAIFIGLMLVKFIHSWVVALGFGQIPTLNSLLSVLVTSLFWIPVMFIAMRMTRKRPSARAGLS